MIAKFARDRTEAFGSVAGSPITEPASIWYGEMSELAEGARLEIVCAVYSSTEGSNPSLSANFRFQRFCIRYLPRGFGAVGVGAFPLLRGSQNRKILGVRD